MPMLWVPILWILPRLTTAYFVSLTAGGNDGPSAPVPFKSLQIGSKPGGTTTQTVQIDPSLRVTSENVQYDPLTKIYLFRTGVIARYGLTTIQSDRLTIHTAVDEQSAEASGHVRVDDPEATIESENLKFSWIPTRRTGSAENVVLRIANVKLTAKQAVLGPDRWDFYGVTGTSSRESRPLYQIETGHLVIHPGRNGVIKKPSLYILGQKIVTLPDHTFNLNPRTEGFQYPNLTYRSGQGFGINFFSGFLLSPTTNLSVAFGVNPSSRPGYGGTLTRSFLGEEQSASIVTPSSDFAERFRYGYLDNVQITSLSQEERILSSTRNSASLGTTWNSTLIDRGPDLAYSKPLEAVYENGGSSRGFAFLEQIHLETIREGSEAMHNRAVFVGAIEPPRLAWGSHLYTTSRLDTNVYVGNEYAWLRGSLGLVYEPNPHVALAAGGFLSSDSGHSLLPIDPLFATAGYIVRGDLNLGPTKFSYITKYDRTLGWYDHEYQASQVMGSFEAFVISRRHPSEYNIGIRFRLDEFYDVLRRRNFNRTMPSPPVIISQP